VNSSASSEIYVGLMSGTSLDGIDVAIVDFGNFPPRIIHGHTTPYPDSVRQRLRDLCQSPSTTLENLYGLDAELGELYADAVIQALIVASLDTDRVIALGCHGQTIRHSPDSATPFTAQIGDPNRIAALTGITTVADFRRKDIALGGQAAPLAPAFHRYLFRSDEDNRVLINIGGIANISYLPANPGQPVLGFDTGPGNTLLNYWNEKHRGSAFDDGGAWASSGAVIDSLLERMIAEEDYFRLDPPKSTGTEYFNSNWLLKFLNEKYDANDVQATLVELTTITIAGAISRLPQRSESFYVCGGGAHNEYLLERLKGNLPAGKMATTEALGLDPDFVEAAAFAWLARERINLRAGNIAEVTQARQACILGGIYAPD
jgi:anhydro-N-acetylmuramic acid kinase